MFFFFFPNDLPRFGPELTRFQHALRYVRDVHPQMSVSALATFVTLAHRQTEIWTNGLSLSDVAADLGVPYNSFVRTTELLGEGGNKIKGLGLIEKGMDPKNRKARRVIITPAGRKMLEHIENALKPLTDEDDAAIGEIAGSKNASDSK